MKTEITISIDTDRLQGVTDQYLVCLWAVAQANPADIDCRDAADVTEDIGREIIRRFLQLHGLPLFDHQGLHPYQLALQKFGDWHDGEFVPHPAPEAAPCTSL
jgi:hypothetical protein